MTKLRPFVVPLMASFAVLGSVMSFVQAQSESPQAAITPEAQIILLLTEAPAESNSQMMVLEALRTGDVEFSERSIRRHYALNPSFETSQVDLFKAFGDDYGRLYAHYRKKAESLLPSSLFVYGSYLLWSGNKDGASEYFAMCDFVSGGDNLALRLSGGNQDRYLNRATQALAKQDEQEVLALSALSLATSATPHGRGKLFAALVSAKMLRAASSELQALLEDEDSGYALHQVLPKPESSWWSANSIVELAGQDYSKQTSLCDALITALCNALIGREDIAFQAFEHGRNLLSEEKAEEKNKVLTNRMLQFESYLASCYGTNTADLSPEQRVSANPKSALELTRDHIRSGELKKAAELLLALEREKVSDESLPLLRAVLFMLQLNPEVKDSSDLESVSIAMSDWIVGLDHLNRDDEILQLAFGGDRWGRLETQLLKIEKERPESLHAKLLLTFAGFVHGKPDSNRLSELLLIAPNAPVVESLIAMHDRYITPKTVDHELSAKEYLSLGDAAFTEGDYSTAMNRYTAAGQKNASIEGLSRALLRASFALGKYDDAASHLERLWDNEGVKSLQDARKFTSGVRSAYGFTATGKERFLHALNKLEEESKIKLAAHRIWLLKGILQFENRDYMSAADTLGKYIDAIAPEPRPEAAFFRSAAEQQ